MSKYICPICGSEFTILSAYSEHIAAHAQAAKDSELKKAKKEVEDAHALLLEAAEKYNSISTTDQVQVNIIWNTLRKSNLGVLKGIDTLKGLDSLRGIDNMCRCKKNKSDNDNNDDEDTFSFEKFLKDSLNIGDAEKKNDRDIQKHNQYERELKKWFTELFDI